MRVLYLSDPLPAPAASGALVLYRHLRSLATHAEVAVAHPEMPDLPVTYFPITPRPLARILARLRRGVRHLTAFDDILGWRFSDQPIDSFIETWKPNVILTVAQGGLCHNARRVAERHRLPLVSIYHDWSPDWRDHPPSLRPALERAFFRVHRASRVALCISPGMKAALGPHRDARVLYPIPEGFSSNSPPPAPDAPVIYSGVLNGLYQDDILRLVSHLRVRVPSGLPVVFHGPNPHWGDPVGRAFLKSPLYRGFLPAEEFRRRLTEASALLVVMPFSPKNRRFAELSFPSKLTEYVSIGRPIMIWGPAYSSAAAWARDTGGATIVTDENPAALLLALDHLSADRELQSTLISRATAEATTRFASTRLQVEFETALSDSIADHRR